MNHLHRKLLLLLVVFAGFLPGALFAKAANTFPVVDAQPHSPAATTYDFGDAPNPHSSTGANYPTLLADNGPRHSTCNPINVRDDFDTASFSNNDGSDNWSGDWIENDPQSGGAGPFAGQVRVVGGDLRLDDYPDTGGEPSAAREVDLSGAAYAEFSFEFFTSSGVDYDDSVTVEVSQDGGATWTPLEVITGVVGEVIEDRSYIITAFASVQTQIRFRVNNKYGGSGEYFYVNYAQINAICGFIVDVSDDFTTSSFTNNDGPTNWSGAWVENDPQAGGAGPGTGQVQVISGTLRLDDYPNTGGEPSAARQVDLSGTTSTFFIFDFQTGSGVDTDDSVTVEVSDDGGASWTTLEVITEVKGTISEHRDFDISPFNSPETQIRFRVSNKYGGSNEFFYVDNVRIYSTGFVPTISLRLGSLWDAEADGQPDDNAMGDDLNVDDEDGVAPTPGIDWVTGDGGGSVDVIVTNCPGTCYLNAWADWNANGVFTNTGENILIDSPVISESQTVTFNIPASVTFNTGYFLRFRLYPNSTVGTASPVGLVNGGEVEDYYWSFGPTAVTLTRFAGRSNPGDSGMILGVIGLIVLVGIRKRRKIIYK